ELVLDARGGERLVELLDVHGRDTLIRTAKQSQHRTLELRGRRGGGDAGKALAAGGGAVKANDARETVVLHPLHKRVEAAEAEADRKDEGDTCAGRVAQIGDGGGDVVIDVVQLCLRDVCHEIEVVRPRGHARRAPEVVDHHCLDTGG